ncbi:MAG: dethiobiotin synthase [Holosporales bacterium]|jgi:dethiobiotin synthetase|nr:dethiobiotin synthase [Holosporales bacterium]
MTRPLFITGTDTDVGKTIVSSWVCAHSTAKYWKPVQTGADSDASVVARISAHTEIIPEAYKLRAPLSAYDAAKLEDINIELSNILKQAPAPRTSIDADRELDNNELLQKPGNHLVHEPNVMWDNNECFLPQKLCNNLASDSNVIIEGAGGVFVPIAKGVFMIDLIKMTNSNVIVVSKSKLGFQNHIYLTIEALRLRGIDVIGIVLNGETEFVDTIETFAKTKVLHVFPWENDIEGVIKRTELPDEIRRAL